MKKCIFILFICIILTFTGCSNSEKTIETCDYEKLSDTYIKPISIDGNELIENETLINSETESNIIEETEIIKESDNSNIEDLNINDDSDETSDETYEDKLNETNETNETNEVDEVEFDDSYVNTCKHVYEKSHGINEEYGDVWDFCCINCGYSYSEPIDKEIEFETETECVHEHVEKIIDEYNNVDYICSDCGMDGLDFYYNEIENEIESEEYTDEYIESDF